jgi:hypothetical protein
MRGSITSTRRRILVIQAIDWTIGELGFDYRQGHEFSLTSTKSRPAVILISGSYKIGIGANPAGLKRRGREAKDSTLPSVHVRNGGAIPPLSHTSSWFLKFIKH